MPNLPNSYDEAITQLFDLKHKLWAREGELAILQFELELARKLRDGLAELNKQLISSV